MLKKQRYNLLKSILLVPSLVTFFVTGLFAVSKSSDIISSEKSSNILLKPIKNLNDDEYDIFILGRSFFTIPWVEAPSATTARDGLGPLFNANTCISCHPNNARGNLYNTNSEFSRSLVGKLAIKSDASIKHENLIQKQGFIPEPTYGGQMAINGNHGIKFEGKPDIKFEEIEVVFPDGEIDILQKPIYAYKELGYGDFHKDTIMTFRLAPSLNGLGLLEDISQEDILKNVDEFDKNKDRVSGRANFVYSPISKKIELGRFNWKASTSSVKHQSADAAINDMGLTTKYFPKDKCTKAQIECQKAPKARDAVDLPNNRLDAITFYIKNLRTYSSQQDDNYKKGLDIFKNIGCVKCHIDSFTTKSGIEISPFTDLLLHDMGEGLADGRAEFKASGSEWRTPPLWGLALHKLINKKAPRLMHDGRAKDFQEAILWHGGEASSSKNNYMNLDKKQREDLINFLKRI